MKLLTFIILAGAILILGSQSISASDKQKVVGLRLQLTSMQLDSVGSNQPLRLTSDQKQKVLEHLGKSIAEVNIVYGTPDGEVEELGYNLALRDRPDSILILPQFAMNPDEVAKKHRDNVEMIGTPEGPQKESVDFFIDGGGRISRSMSVDEFANYVKAHRSDFGYITIHNYGNGSLASRDTQRFMNSKLKETSAITTQ